MPYEHIPNRTLFPLLIRLRPVIVSMLFAATAALSACATDEAHVPRTVSDISADASTPGTASNESIKVVTSTAVIANLVRNVGGSHVSIHNLVPPGADVHTHQTTPQDSVAIAGADLIVSNGAGLLPQVVELIEQTASSDAVQVTASQGLEPEEFTQFQFPQHRNGQGRFPADDHASDAPGHHDDDDDDRDDDHSGNALGHRNDDDDHGSGDPHFWQNPSFMVHYVNKIADGLIAVDPENGREYLNNAAGYIGQLERLEAYIVDQTATIPPERRVIVTFHDAFGYFGARFGFEVLAFVGAHGGDVAPDDILSVLDLVQDRGLPAVFAEPQFSADALEQVARDAGIEVGLIRSLPDDQYPEYVNMMRANIDVLAELLR